MTKGTDQYLDSINTSSRWSNSSVLLYQRTTWAWFPVPIVGSSHSPTSSGFNALFLPPLATTHIPENSTYKHILKIFYLSIWNHKFHSIFQDNINSLSIQICITLPLSFYNICWSQFSLPLPSPSHQNPLHFFLLLGRNRVLKDKNKI